MNILDKEDLTQKDIMDLISFKTEESISLEFKSAQSLENTNQNKNEISKDVSAFANSCGGYIVYGMIEQNHIASGLSYIDGNDTPKEWLEQVIQSRISKKIENLKIIPIRFDNDIQKTIYVVKIPESATKPHMSSDKKYYRRYNFQSVPMEEYEVSSQYNTKKRCSLSFHSILIDKMYRTEDTTVFFRLYFLIQNTGKNISEIYKLKIIVNYPELNLRIDRSFNIPNTTPIMPDQNKPDDKIKHQITFCCQSPIYPDEILTIGDIEFGIDLTKIKSRCKDEMLDIRLYYEGGYEDSSWLLSGIFSSYLSSYLSMMTD